jgi:hypothetical protein
MKYNHQKLLWHCRLCLLMPDHLHAILALPREPGMTTVIKNWKKYVAGKHGVDWQRDFFDHRLRDHHEVDEKTNYILMNPVRKACVSGRETACGSIGQTTVRLRCSGRASAPAAWDVPGRHNSPCAEVGRVTSTTWANGRGRPRRTQECPPYLNKKEAGPERSRGPLNSSRLNVWPRISYSGQRTRNGYGSCRATYRSCR